MSYHVTGTDGKSDALLDALPTADVECRPDAVIARLRAPLAPYRVTTLLALDLALATIQAGGNLGGALRVIAAGRRRDRARAAILTGGRAGLRVGRVEGQAGLLLLVLVLVVVRVAVGGGSAGRRRRRHGRGLRLDGDGIAGLAQASSQGARIHPMEAREGEWTWAGDRGAS